MLLSTPLSILAAFTNYKDYYPPLDAVRPLLVYRICFYSLKHRLRLISPYLTVPYLIYILIRSLRRTRYPYLEGRFFSLRYSNLSLLLTYLIP
jgi:hypothetical protein